MDSKNRVFWGSYVVRSSKGILIAKGEIYSRSNGLPLEAIDRIVKRYNSKRMIKFLPGVRCFYAE